MRCDAVDLNFIRGQFTEAELESAIISLFTEQGYDYVLGETIHRGFEEILLRDDLSSYLSAHYPDGDLLLSQITYESS